ncbi:MAG TPA: hypothetical protein VGG29_10385 [Caulobacteraceae bacterium]
MPDFTADASIPPAGCACEEGRADHTRFETRELGVDETQGRFAEVSLCRCKACGRLWLRYFVEYEAFGRSGRWARGLIGEEAAAAMTPQAAEPYLRGLDGYLYGGSYFGGVTGRRRGPMPWGP